MKRKLNQRGNFSLFALFILVGMSLLILFAFVIPFLLSFNTKMYESAEFLITDAQETANQINDENVRAAMSLELTAAKNSIQFNQSTLSFGFQYGWIFIILALGFIVWLEARRQKETAGAVY